MSLNEYKRLSWKYSEPQVTILQYLSSCLQEMSCWNVQCIWKIVGLAGVNIGFLLQCNGSHEHWSYVKYIRFCTYFVKIWSGNQPSIYRVNLVVPTINLSRCLSCLIWLLDQCANILWAKTKLSTNWLEYSSSSNRKMMMIIIIIIVITC